MKKLLPMLLIAVSATPALADHSAGVVTDSSGKPVLTASGCLLFGSPEPGACDKALGKMHDHSSMASSGDSMAMSDSPVVKEVINLKGVTFKTGSAELNSSSYDRLNTSAQNLNENPDLKVIVAGHTDNTGDTLNNLNLSQKRAETVRQYLVDQGIDGSRLTARGYGDTEPTATNDTAAGRAQNRRVELRVLE